MIPMWVADMSFATVPAVPAAIGGEGDVPVPAQEDVRPDLVGDREHGQGGRAFHGPCHIRVNLALPRSRVEEALDRLERYVFCE